MEQNKSGYIAVIGAVNMDICGTPAAPLLERDSNPGTVSITPGGVGLNIAQNLSRLGASVRFVTALGDDAFAKTVTGLCTQLGIGLSDAVFVPGRATSVYLFITDPGGEMRLAVADTDISSEITPKFLEARLDMLNAADLVVFDGNLAAETIAWLAKSCTAPLFADPVSAAKAVKLKPALGALHTIKPNTLEAEVLSGVAITDEASLKKAALALLETGAERVFITLGEDGVLLAEGDLLHFFPRADASAVVNTSGCGDAAMAALAWSYRCGDDPETAAALAMAAASFALECAGTVNPGLSAEAVRRRAKL